MNETINKYIKTIKEQEIKYKLISSNEMLNHVDQIALKFKDLPENDQELAHVLLDVFGLLQALFVAVDSLYNMVLTITKNKYYININQNYFIHELKFIRNDVVGHPTNRKYGKYGVGYTKIDTKRLSNKKLTYQVMIFRDDELIENSRTIDFTQLIDAYLTEKQQIYRELEIYLNADYKNIDFSSKVLNIHQNLSFEKIESVRSEFISTYTNYERHRFLWRLQLLEIAYFWEDNRKLFKELIDHIIEVQGYKLYQISRNMENKNYNIPKLIIPKILRQFYSVLNKQPDLIAYIHNLNDPNHPFYQADLNHLRREIKHNNVSELLDYLDKLEDNNKKYLIGSLLKQYRPKNQ